VSRNAIHTPLVNDNHVHQDDNDNTKDVDKGGGINRSLMYTRFTVDTLYG
jgi:hypothetical protein